MIYNIPKRGTDEYGQAVRDAVRAKRFDTDVAAAVERSAARGKPSSWERINLHDVIYGDTPEVVPRWLRRNDGMTLLYPGCTHSIHGPTGHGKTWLALLAIAQLLLETDEHALYLDYESFGSQVVARLKRLGVPHDAIDTRFHYYRPTRAPDVLDIDRIAFSHMISQPYGIAVIDGANISMMRCGLNTNVAEDVARWHDAIMLPIAERTGAAVVANDHVAKASERNGFAIGSQHKIAGLTGAGFTVEKIEPFGRGREGKATVRVGEKDREGYVHEIGVNDEQPDGMLVGELRINALDPDAITAGLWAATKDTVARVAAKRAPKRPKAADAVVVERPRAEMEVVSAYWEEMKDDPSARSGRKTVERIRARQTGGLVMSKHRLEDAISLLTDESIEGGPYAKADPGAHGAKVHTNRERYYAREDPTRANLKIKPRTEGENEGVDIEGEGGVGEAESEGWRGSGPHNGQHSKQTAGDDGGVRPAGA